MGSAVQVRLLGRFDVRAPGGASVEQWPRPTARRLVQLLLLEPGHVVHRERAADLLFPEATPDRSPRLLSKALSQARAALAAADAGLEAALQADPRVLSWSDSFPLVIDLDLHRRALQAALDESDPERRADRLGEALRHCLPLLPDDPYDEWTAAAADDLEQLRQRGRVVLAETRAARASGLDGRVADAWRDVVEHDPTSESACIALMAAHAVAGDRVRVVRAFQSCVEALRSQVGVAPSVQLQDAYRRSLASLRSAVDVVAPSAPALYGRDRELAQVRRAALAGTTVLVAGPAGMGKTALLGAVCRGLVDEGWLALTGTAVVEDELSPYAALRTALRPHLASDEVSEELGSLLHGGPLSDDAAEGREQRLANAVAEALDQLSARGRPVAVVVDDVHWADAALAALLHRLTARPVSGARRWTLLLGGRTDEPGRPLPTMPTDATRVDLSSLSDEAAGELVRAQVRDVADVADIVARGAGNPFFLTELARSGGSSGTGDVPQRVRELVDHRLSSCTAQAARLASLIAVAAEDASYDVVVAAGTDAIVVADAEVFSGALDELMARHLVVEVADGVRIAHPLLRDALLNRTNAVRRAALHTLVAEALAHDDGRSFAAARHRVAAYRCSGMQETAVAAARTGFEAGQRAYALAAYDVCLELLGASLDAFEHLPGEQRKPLRAAALQAWIKIGHLRLDRGEPGAADAYANATGLAATDDERAQCASASAGVAYNAGDFELAAQIYQTGLDSLVEASEVPRARLQSDLGWVAFRLGDNERAVELCRKALTVLDSAGDDPQLCRCLDRLSLALNRLGYVDEALDLAARAFQLIEHDDPEGQLGVLLMHRALLLLRADQPGAALPDAEAAVAWHRQRGQRYLLSVSLNSVADAHAALGQYADALAARDAERDLLREVGNERHLLLCEAQRAELLTALGRDEEAAQAQRTADELSRRVGDFVGVVEPRPVVASPRGSNAGTDQP